MVEITPERLRLRYPAFAAVSDATITYWLTDAARIVTPDWGDEQEAGALALAAHNMATTPGVVAGSADPMEAALAKVQASGVTSFRSGSFSANVSEAAVASQIAGGYASTVYGREFAIMLRRNTGGPMLVGYVETCGYADVL